MVLNIEFIPIKWNARWPPHAICPRCRHHEERLQTRHGTPGSGHQNGDIGMRPGKTGVERGDPAATPAGQLRQPGVGDLAMPGHALWIDFQIRERIVPESMPGQLVKPAQRVPGRRTTSVERKLHVQAQQGPFGHRTGRKRFDQAIEPANRPGMLWMAGQRDGDKHVAVQQPTWGRGISAGCSSGRHGRSAVPMPQILFVLGMPDVGLSQRAATRTDRKSEFSLADQQSAVGIGRVSGRIAG